MTTTEQSNDVIGETGPIVTAGVNAAQRFEVTTAQGQTIVSEVSSLAVDQGNNCLLTQCITKHIFPFQKFILLDSELDLGGHLQKRVCHKLNVCHGIQGCWEMMRMLI